MTKTETDRIYNLITSNGMREMTQERFHQAVNEILDNLTSEQLLGIDLKDVPTKTTKRITLRDFLLKKFPPKKYIDCPVLHHHWETIQEYAEAYHRSSGMNWTKEKPKCDHECILLTASRFHNHWEYGIFTVEKADDGDHFYWGLFEDGCEWGDVDDLQADLYLEMPLLKK